MRLRYSLEGHRPNQTVQLKLPGLNELKGWGHRLEFKQTIRVSSKAQRGLLVLQCEIASSLPFQFHWFES